jgi:hypothetical protein
VIIRSGRKDNFTVINNALINDGNLDWKELGLLVYLLSKPNNWVVCTAHLQKQRKTGRDGIYSMLKKLCDAGYVSKKPNPNGGWNYIVYDEPKKPLTDNPDADFPLTAFPLTENPTLIKTECLIKTDKNTTTTENTQKKESAKENNNCGGGNLGIIFSKALSRKDVDKANAMLKVINQDVAQEIADVLTAMIEAGDVKKNPIALLGGLIRRYQAGTFDNSTGLHINARREAKAKNSKQVKKSEEVDHDAVMANLAKMRKKQKQIQGNISA